MYNSQMNNPGYGNGGMYGGQGGYNNGMNNGMLGFGGNPYSGNGFGENPYDNDDNAWCCGDDGPDYGGVGAMPIRPFQKAPPFVGGSRRRLNVLAMILCLLIPWALFTGVYWVLSFSLRYGQPAIAWGLVGVAALCVLLAGCCALQSTFKKVVGDPTREPNWYMFFFMSMVIAFLLAVVCGQYNFQMNLQPFYDMENLGNFTNIDPSRIRGQQVMDAGQITFSAGTRLDLSKSMGFKSENVYCVAPITMPSETPAQYDFWAVGTDCCSGSSADFHCKNFNDPGAIGALRETQDMNRAMYRLAVQQAEATYHIKATHPLFFIWTHDPAAEMEGFRGAGTTWFLAGVFGHFVFQAFLVAVASIAFSKMGFY